MEEQNNIGISCALINVMDSQISTFTVRNFYIMRRERVTGKILKSFIGCS
jgi:hypothetical protein